MGKVLRALRLFGHFFLESFTELKTNFSSYAGSLYTLIALELLALLPLERFGITSGEKIDLLIKLIITFFTLVVLVNIIIIKKSKVNLLPKESLLFSSCTYLIYTLYTTLIFLGVGFLFFMLISLIPQLHDYVKIGIGGVAAIAILWLLALVPLASVLIDNDQINYFKMSIKLVKKNYWLVLVYGICTIAEELISFVFNWATQNQLEVFIGIFSAIISPVLTLILTLVSVRIFYYLKDLSMDYSQ